MQPKLLVIGSGYDASRVAEAVIDNGMEVLAIEDGQQLKRLDGQIGCFKAVYMTPQGENAETVAAVIVAIGADLVPCSLLDSGIPQATSYSALSSLLQQNGDIEARRLIFIQDIDEDDGQWVSASGIDLARRVRRQWGCEVYYLCRFVRGAHFEVEDAYRQARAEGVAFIKYKKDTLAIKSSEMGLTVLFNDYYQDIAIRADMVVISEMLKPKDETSLLAERLNIGLSPEGFFQYDNAYYPFAATNRRGVYAVGACKGPVGLNDVMGDALYAVLDIKSQLADLKPLSDIIAKVNPFKCSLCLTCMRFCHHRALHISDDMPAMAVYDMACQGCGICGAVCPADAIKLSDNGKAIIKEAADVKKLKVYCCQNSAEKALAKIAQEGWLPEGVELAKMPCSGSIKPEELVKDLYAGFQRILILSCYSDACKHIEGNKDMRRQVEALRGILNSMGLPEDSIQVMDIAGPSAADVMLKIRSAYESAKMEVAP